MGEERLFASRELAWLLRERHGRCLSKLKSLSDEEVSSQETGVVVQRVLDEYLPVAPALGEPYQDVPTAREVVVRHDPDHDPRRPFRRTVPVLTLRVPFAGEAGLLEHAPAGIFYRPLGVIEANEIVFKYLPGRAGPRMLGPNEAKPEDPEAEAANRFFNEQLAHIQEGLRLIKDEISASRADFAREFGEQLESRRSQLAAARRLSGAIGFPLKARQESNNVFVVPVQRKSLPSSVASSVGKLDPEVVILDEHYDFILKLLYDAGRMIECNPAAFAQMDEPDLRWVLLLPLNAHYAGQATGETFNVSGKTDILVRQGAQTLFVAECKIWHGPEDLRRAVDQLLGYLSPREMKAAILLFSRLRDFGTVRAKIEPAIRGHAAFKGPLPSPAHAAFRCVLARPGDPSRLITLTVLAFDIVDARSDVSSPAESASSGANSV